jgi:hypothetical protein
MDRAFNTNGNEEACIRDVGGKARRKDAARKIQT